MSETYRSRNGQGTTRGGSSRSTRTREQSSADRILAVQNARNRGSGTGTGNTRRPSTNGRGRRKRRRQSPDFAKFILILIGVAIVILCAAVGFKSCSKSSEPKETQTEATTAEPETEIEAEITVNGISVHGLTKTQAKEKVLEAMGWGMTVSYNGEKKDLVNLMESKVESVIDEALDKGEAGTYTVTAEGLEDHVKTLVETLASGWDVKAKNGSISSYDAASGEFVFAGAENGTVIDQDGLVKDILAALTSGDYKKDIAAKASSVEPEITEAEAKASFKRLGTYTTTTTSNKDRNENIKIASAAINGIIIKPGEEFSFNLTTGNRTLEKGYKPAGAYLNGVLVEEPGGGVCQVSSTLYNAVVFSGLKTTERHAHSYEPSYVTPGEDAMVSYDGYSGPDMKFVNNSKTAVGIKTSFSNQKLTISIYGNPILEEGVTLSMTSEKVKELDPPAPTYEEDPTLQPGVEVVAKAATPGSRWVTNLVTKKNGEVVSDVLLHNSAYYGKPATIKRNTSGSVQSTEGESTSAESSQAAESQTTAAPSEGAETTAPAPSVEPSVQNPSGPGYEPEESSAQSQGPQNTIETSGAGSQDGPQTPVTMPQTSPETAAQTPQAGEGPSDVGLISPIG